ncbi:hypothetical protein J6590_049452 [Homalodisca vitripennis]|nr:hypothetical protein J6590_049452 [Homalodisca vitripennis]
MNSNFVFGRIRPESEFREVHDFTYSATDRQVQDGLCNCWESGRHHNRVAGAGRDGDRASHSWREQKGKESGCRRRLCGCCQSCIVPRLPVSRRCSTFLFAIPRKCNHLNSPLVLFTKDFPCCPLHIIDLYLIMKSKALNP